MNFGRSIANRQGVKNNPTRRENFGRQKAASLRIDPVGGCVCPICGEQMIHRVGRFCLYTKCPKCGSRMTQRRLQVYDHRRTNLQSTPFKDTKGSN